MPYFPRDGYAMHCEIHGRGRPVVLQHGICVSFAGNHGARGWIERLCGYWHFATRVGGERLPGSPGEVALISIANHSTKTPG